MNYLSTSLNGKGLLSLLIAYTLSGTALADVAGRVNFVSGNVEVIATDGSRRALVKGELVNSGERLETNRGRVQIRFTDGSFISLQPNTVFGLDKYSFDKNKPNDGSLLFNFLRGGMRTVSGAIGKVNRANYKVQTPVATIGIRGTSYAANQEPNGKLLLTVGSGIVNLENNFGFSNVNTGQTFQVETGQAPNQAPAGTTVSARGDAPESKEEKEVANLNKTNVIIDDPYEVFIQTYDGLPRLSSFGSLLVGTSGVKIYPNVIGKYSKLSDDGKQVGNLLGLIGTKLTGGNTAGKELLETAKKLGGLQFTNVKQIGSLSFGEWTNGSASLVDPYLGTVQQLTLTDKQFMPYIVGTTAEKSLGNNMKVSYVLAGATPARAGTDIGTLNKLNIDIDLNLMPLVSVDMAANVKSITYTAKLSNYPILDISADKKFSGFILPKEELFATSSTANICANSQCPVDLSAFLSGNDLGVVYQINRKNLTAINGVAALTGTESTITNNNIANPLASSLNSDYSALFSHKPIITADNKTIKLTAANNLSAIFDSKTQGLMAASASIFTDTPNFYGAVGSATESAAQIQQVGHVAKVLSWGRWTNGRLATGNDDIPINLTANDNIHYLIGLPTAATAIPNVGSVTYSLVGGTASAVFGTINNNQINTNFDIAKVNSGSLMVDFGRATTNLSLELNGFTKANSLQSLQLSGAGTLAAGSNDFSFNNLNVSASSAQNPLVCTNCTASANGMFFGAVGSVATSNLTAPTAAGVVYSINGTVQGSQATSIEANGTASFANPTPNPQNNQGS
ncbi:MAG TPA: FecR domain-containing protein [Agitococcus sp.]|nr:FecR domain-containing protein [Agitococcus sp.]HNC86923.1 FecR domain-containing protein [Agitococcus sp.]HNN28568.1 FecR domain-containing protein [Agitococcus sp.]